MSLFQASVLNKYKSSLDNSAVTAAFERYQVYFPNKEIQENIRESKEEQFQEGFLRELFVKVLGYTINPSPDYNLTTEFKNQKGAKKADGAIIIDSKAIGVIELKSTKTKNLEAVRQQAFDYKANQPACRYVVTSNFEKLRFYIDNAVEFEEFDLFYLNRERFEILYLCLARQSIFQGLPEKVRVASSVVEEEVTKRLYTDYSAFKKELFSNIVELNIPPGISEEEGKNFKKVYFKKTQKLLDRFLFVFFAEDKGLLEPNTISREVNNWERLKEMDAYSPLYERYKNLFNHINSGFEGKDYQIFGYNGGLFQADSILDTLKINDGLLKRHTMKLTGYDFESEIDVNILGHIFENSLEEIEIINAELADIPTKRDLSKRKKDGIFYTPKDITKFIVERTLGSLCEEKKNQLGIVEEDYYYKRGKRKQTTSKVKQLVAKVDQYREWLLDLAVLDPACGSGAFLNQALNYLIQEHRYLDELKAKLYGDNTLIFPDVQNTILERNIYGVDINEESVEIAKLSLWLRTAQKGRKLSVLSDNLKCGDSLVDDPAIKGEVALGWHSSFPEVFEKGGFDVVIGNPPYGAYIDDATKAYCKDRFDTFEGNFEIYFFFIELLSMLTKPGGKAGYITPDTWMNVPQATKLRKHILDNYHVESIAAFDYSVFKDASVNPVLFNLRKGCISERPHCEFLHAKSQKGPNFPDNSTSLRIDTSNWVCSKDKQFQLWQRDFDIEIIKKIEKCTLRGVDILDVSQGIVPYSTENLTNEQVKARIYHSESVDTASHGPWVQGRAIRRFAVDVSSREYLKYGNWLHRPRKPKYFNGERILVQEITGGNPPRISASIYSENLYHDPGIISCINQSQISSEYLIALINSTLMSWYIRKTAPKGKRTTFPKVLIGDIRKFPIKEAPATKLKQVEEHVKEIQVVASNKIKASANFTAYVLSTLSLPKASKRILSWPELNFKEFVSELNKLLKEQKLNKLTKSDELEWMSLFEDEKAKVAQLEQRFQLLDKSIDAAVFEIYGIGADEVERIHSQE